VESYVQRIVTKGKSGREGICDKRSGIYKRIGNEQKRGGGKEREVLSELRSVRKVMVDIQDCVVFWNYLIQTWYGSPCG
jgi:hypothetical protein